MAYNNSRWLAACIESVFAQTYPADEIITANDASTDGSREIIRALANRGKEYA